MQGWLLPAAVHHSSFSFQAALPHPPCFLPTPTPSAAGPGPVGGVPPGLWHLSHLRHLRQIPVRLERAPARQHQQHFMTAQAQELACHSISSSQISAQRTAQTHLPCGVPRPISLIQSLISCGSVAVFVSLHFERCSLRHARCPLLQSYLALPPDSTNACHSWICFSVSLLSIFSETCKAL